ncbi:hypothetical protein Val02_21640 [Virgisporangium aliadipatigenens]|uniref:Condensation domain-containing protein n=1 Tax=Virgisporangium aliadipatigenens TaxID=741659 RepID=A0A8J3YK18_9ACTN|nr:condensation domain-containing protein [Virgisporangium aliadipatigenens]GIJ45278.1 hypothetical protein Val02_21640 [Virgisporangium aliadipatigenens]
MIAQESAHAVAEFIGGRAMETAPTWGQRSIWKALGQLAPNDHFLNMRRLISLSERAGATPASAASAVGTVIERYEALRTRYETPDGRLRQIVQPSGRLDIEIVDAVPGTLERAGVELRDRLWRRSFDHAAELPLRVGFVTVDGRVRRIALVASHLSVDGYAADTLLRDLRLALLRGRLPRFTGLQPVDLAPAEAAGTATSARAVRYWTDQLRAAPVTMFAAVGAPADPPYQRHLLTCRPLAEAALSLARRHRTGTATVLMAATAALVGRWTGHRRVAMHTLVHNRFRPGYADVVGTLVMQGLLVLDTAGEADLEELVPRTRHAALRAYRCAYYDPRERDAATAELSRLRGAVVDPHCCFNDVRLSADDAPLPAGPPAPRIRAQEHPAVMHCRFCVELHDTPDGLGVLLTADTRYLPPPSMRAFLRELAESVLCAATTRPR